MDSEKTDDSGEGVVFQMADDIELRVAAARGAVVMLAELVGACERSVGEEFPDGLAELVAVRMGV